MTQPIFPDLTSQKVVGAFPMPQFMPRTRREWNTTDVINARQFEHWQTDGKFGAYDRPDMNRQAPFMDMMPNASRSNSKSYRSQPRFDVNAEQGVQNPYFMKYDATFDSRNMARELRGSVYEDKKTSFEPQSHALIERNVEHRWFLPVAPTQQVDAAEILRPKMDHIENQYR